MYSVDGNKMESPRLHLLLNELANATTENTATFLENFEWNYKIRAQDVLKNTIEKVKASDGSLELFRKAFGNCFPHLLQTSKEPCAGEGPAPLFYQNKSELLRILEVCMEILQAGSYVTAMKRLLDKDPAEVVCLGDMLEVFDSTLQHHAIRKDDFEKWFEIRERIQVVVEKTVNELGTVVIKITQLENAVEGPFMIPFSIESMEQQGSGPCIKDQFIFASKKHYITYKVDPGVTLSFKHQFPTFIDFKYNDLSSG